MPRLRPYTPIPGGMVEFQLQRRIEMRRAPETTGKGIRTAGTGSAGNVAHLNLKTSIRASKANSPLPGPMGLKDRQVVQLAMAGNSAEKIAWALGADIADVVRVMDKYGLQSPVDGVSSQS